MCGFEIRQVDEVTLAADRALQRDQVGKGADGRLHAVDATGVSASKEFCKRD